MPKHPKKQYLLDNFNLTPEMWQRIYDHQQGLCGICRQPLADRIVNTDHRHSDGLVRGLACFNCNRAIRESFTVEFVTAILDYLTNPPATAALGHPHYGLPGRIGTAKRRKLIKKLRQKAAP